MSAHHGHRLLSPFLEYGGWGLDRLIFGKSKCMQTSAIELGVIGATFIYGWDKSGRAHQSNLLGLDYGAASLFLHGWMVGGSIMSHH